MEVIVNLTISIFLLSIIIVAFFKNRLKVYAIMIPLWTTISVVVYHLYTKVSLFDIHKETISVMANIKESGTTDETFINKAIESIEKLMTDNFKTSIDFVIGLLGIVVSVWVGLTIYNAVKKDELDKLIKNVDDEKELNKQVYLANLQRALDIEGTSSEYYSKQFYKMSEKNINHQVIGNILVIETHFHRVANYYNENNYEAILRIVNYGFSLCNDFEKKIEKENVGSVIEGYFYQRKGDFYYYKAMSEMYTNFKCKESIKYALEFYNKALEKDSNINYRGYMDNTFGFLYLLLARCEQNKNTKKTLLEEAKQNLLTACSTEYSNSYTNSKNEQLYLYIKNLGCVYEELGEFDNALEKYEEAITSNPQDYKSRICAASFYIKQIQRELGISSERKVPLCESSFIPSETIYRNIENAEKHLMAAEKIAPSMIDVYYKFGQLYTYLLLMVQNEERQSFLNKIKSCFSTANSLNKTFMAHKFHERNFYEAIGDIKTAKRINDELLKLEKNGKNDCITINELYLECLKKDEYNHD